MTVAVASIPMIKTMHNTTAEVAVAKVPWCMADAVEDGVGVGRVADHRMPFVDRDLAGEDGRAAAVAFFEDLVEIAAGAGVERFEAPIVEDEELSAVEAAHDARVGPSPRARARSAKSLGTR